MQIKSLLSFILSLLMISPPVLANQTSSNNPVPTEQTTASSHKLLPLPYAYEALEPVIDTETMKIHHQKHHQAYVDNLNKAIAGSNAENQSLTTLLAGISRWPATVRNNAGGHWNHQFFWASLLPPAQYQAPSGPFKQALDKEFGSFDAFKAAFEAVGAGRFGSGWVWLIQKPDGQLAITSTANQDNPLMDIAEVQGTPLLGWDIWEHAYYLKYQNRRGDYLRAMWQIVNWQAVAQRYQTK